jgi:PAS domain S-box-containing protein
VALGRLGIGRDGGGVGFAMPRLLARCGRPLTLVVLYVAAYLALDWLSFIHALHGVGITPWSPQAGLSLALLLVKGLGYAPAVLVAALLSNSLSAEVSVPAVAALGAASVMVVGYAGCAFALRRILDMDIRLSRARDVVMLLGAALVAAAFVAVGFVAAHVSGAVIPQSGFVEAAFQFWIGDAIGIAVLTPLLLLVADRSARRETAPAARQGSRLVETAAQALAILAVLFIVFRAGSEPFRLFYLLFLPLIWIAVRRGLYGAAWAVLGIQGGLIAALEFQDLSIEAVRAFQLLMFALAFTGLLLGAVVSERSRAVRALGESESRLAAILNTAPDGVITVDRQGRIERINPAVERQLRLPADRILGRPITDFIAAPDLVARLEAAAGVPSWELAARRADGSSLPIELTAGRLDIGDAHYHTLILRDISLRKESEARARAHAAELAHVSRLSLAGEMASALAHELNQPLTAIVAYARGCLRLLKAPEADRTLTAAAFQQVVQQAERAGAIIGRLREFLREGATHRSTTGIGELIEEALGLAQVEAAQNGVEIRVRVAPGLPNVLVDRIQIEQVLVNLVRNGIEAMLAARGERRLITIEARGAAGGAIELTVADTGPGVAEDVAARLFDPFVTTKPRGMGLGLSISRSIVEAHGGQLQLRPRHAGGAVFAFTLPSSESDVGNA